MVSSLSSKLERRHPTAFKSDSWAGNEGVQGSRRSRVQDTGGFCGNYAFGVSCDGFAIIIWTGVIHSFDSGSSLATLIRGCDTPMNYPIREDLSGRASFYTVG